MGKLFALIAGAMLLGASYLIFNGQRTTLEAREEQSNYEYQGIASNVAKSGFNRGVSAIKRDLMGAPATFERTTMDGGHYDLQIAKNHYGNLSVSVDAESGGAEYDMVGDIIFTAPMPSSATTSIPVRRCRSASPAFDVVDDEAIVNEPFRVRFKVLGAAITAGGSYDMPVTGATTTWRSTATSTRATAA